jgi:putative redox protein
METPMSLSFKPIFEGTQVALKDAPDQANAWFEAQTRLGEGFNSKAVVRQFTAEVDEPAGLGGKDTAPNPVEYILVALGSCQEITYRLYADALGIPLTGVSVKLRGLVDLRGFFAVDSSVRPGFQRIEAEVTLDSPASDADLRRLKETVDRHCPVLDILRNGVPVTLNSSLARRAAAPELAPT